MSLQFNGAFTKVPAPRLGAVAIKSAVEKSSIPISSLSDVYMGQVLQAQSGQAPARQAAIFAGLPTSIEATTINKVCASGLKAVTIATSMIELGHGEAHVAGGMENMSRIPYYIPRAGQQPPFGDQKLVDGLVSDGLWDVYNNVHMGVCAEKTARDHKITREAQDSYAIHSFRRAQTAWKDGHFVDEVVPVEVQGKKGVVTTVTEDESYNKLREDKVPTLKPAFVHDGTGSVTAANSSSFNDGASALVLGSRSIAQEYGERSRVLARIVAYADAAVDPIDFPVAPAKVVPKVLQRAGLRKEDVAVWEFNEAFAAVILANGKILDLKMDSINPRGGAIALGHAIGSSGSRILVTLLHQLEVGQHGCAAICNGGGASTGIIVQRIKYRDI